MRIQALVIFVCAALTSCVGTEVGNPQDTSVSVEFGGYDRQQRGALTLANGVEISEAWLVFDELRLREAADCSGGTQVDVDQAFAVELVSGQEFPGLDAFRRPAGRYCRLEMRLAEADPGELDSGVPSELAGLSILVRGSHDDGTPFVLRDDFNETFRLDGDFRLQDERDRLLVAFALDQWISPAQLDAAEGDTEIVIDENTNRDILDAFRDNVRRSAGLFRDRNDDGALQDDEFGEQLADGVVQ